jgi:hypothetical protein
MGDSMVTFQERFALVFGREPTDKEKQEYTRFVTTIGVSENDALLMFFLFQQRNLDQLAEIPRRIEQAAQATEKAAQAQIATNVSKAATEAVPLLVDMVNKQVENAVQDRAEAMQYKWIAISCVAAFLTIAAALGLGYQVGLKEASLSCEAARAESSGT